MFYNVNNKIIQLYNYPCVAPFENFLFPKAEHVTCDKGYQKTIQYKANMYPVNAI